MPTMTYEGLKNRAAWAAANVRLPQYDPEAVRAATLQNPVWVHFGSGNIFRSFIAPLQEAVLNAGLADRGIIAAESFDFDIIKKIYAPYDSLGLLVILRADGTMEKSVLGSVAGGYTTETDADRAALARFFQNKSLQMLSFTITEKGYALNGMNGAPLPVVQADMAAGPKAPAHVMAVVTSLLLKRYEAGAHPLALVSMDNCSHNGDRLKSAVLDIARAWQKNGFVDQGFVEWLAASGRVTFPWTMIDKITPRPAEVVMKELVQAGIASMEPVVTAKGTFIAPFANAEAAQYLVIEDAFPAGRPPLEHAGVYFADRDTVNRVERMKVTTCLNPLHTALAVFGCLLGYTSIAAEMGDADLKELVRRIGYLEGLPVVTDPGILSPRAFLDEVMNERLPNPFIPDTPQRIATDTSQKIAIRFGETIKAYLTDPALSTDSLVGIPLALAGWLRYLIGVDDDLQPMAVSSDPLLLQLQAALSCIEVGRGQDVSSILQPILSNPVLFGVSLYDAGLAPRVTALFERMLAGRGAVRNTLQENLK